MEVAVSPIYIITNSSKELLNCILQVFHSRSKLVLENDTLHKEVILQKSNQLLLDFYKKENFRLNKLLDLPIFEEEKKIIAKVISNNFNIYNNQVIINKGSKDGIYVGQPVINEQGTVGQVISTNFFTSRVLLICSVNHAIPVQILRNNLRGIIKGNGYEKELILEHLPIDPDIRIGDILVSSGIGGCFLEGYPVAVVSSIEFNSRYSSMLILAKPYVNFKLLNYILLIKKK